MEPSTDVSASRSWGGTLPGVSAIVAMTDALPVLSHDHIDVGGHVAVQLQRHFMLAQRLDGLLHVDLVPVDLYAMLSLEGAGDVLVRDRAESLVLGADLEAHDDGLVVDLVGQRLGSDAVLRLALDGRVLQPRRWPTRSTTRPSSCASRSAPRTRLSARSRTRTSPAPSRLSIASRSTGTRST